jgi:1,4-dihydroxy-2-naphthoyl-CoA hydrolase
MSRLWFGQPTIDSINFRHTNHIGALIGIEFTEIGDDFIKATIPVDARTHQPYGILHGGASVVLAESLGSVASTLIIDTEKYMAVGLEVNANHLRPVKEGKVTGICTPVHIGGKTHVWDIKMYDDRGKMNCISRLTVAIIAKQ